MHRRLAKGGGFLLGLRHKTRVNLIRENRIKKIQVSFMMIGVGAVFQETVMKISPIHQSYLPKRMPDRAPATTATLKTGTTQDDQPSVKAKEKLEHALRNPAQHTAPPSIIQLRIEAMLEETAIQKN